MSKKSFYSFYYQLLKKIHPLNLIAFEITSVCNLSCKHCFLNDESDKKYQLSLDIIRESLTSLAKYNFWKPYISITGGEPLLHSQFKDLLLYLNNEKYKFSLVTNGINIDKEWINYFNSLLFFR